MIEKYIGEQNIARYVEKIIELYIAVYFESPERLGKAQIEAMSQLCQANHISGEVILYEQRLAGFILWVQIQDECADIIELCVHSDFRRQGLATRMLDTMAKQAIQQNICQITLEVSETNQAARAVYEHAGFKNFHRRSGYYREHGRSVDALLMQRQLIL